VIDQIATTNKALAPATVVSVKESGNIYLIDGWSRGLRISASTAKAFGVAKPKVVTRADLTGYNTTGTLAWQKVICGANTYLIDDARPIQIEAAAVSAWPGAAATLDAKTCQKLNPTTTRVGLFVANGVNKYKIIGGKLKPIRTAAEYNTMSNGLTPAASVSTSLIASLAKLNPTSYLVVKGDTLYKVAVKFNTTRALLRTLNRLTTDTLTIGQVLVLP
jgi:hypothetical protein